MYQVILNTSIFIIWNLWIIFKPHCVGFVVIVPTSHALVFAPRPGHTKDHHKNGTNCLPAWHACIRVGRLSKRLGSMWNCLRGHELQRSLGINCKSRVLYLGPGFLSSAISHSMPKKHSNGLISYMQVISVIFKHHLLKVTLHVWSISSPIHTTFFPQVQLHGMQQYCPTLRNKEVI